MPSLPAQLSWVFYIPNYTVADIYAIKRIHLVTYRISVTADDVPHLEGYCILSKHIPQHVLNLFLNGRGELRPATGTPMENISYIQNDGDYHCSLGFVSFAYDLFGEDIFRSGDQNECGNMFLSNVPCCETTVLDPDMPLAIGRPTTFRSMANDV